MMIGDLNGIIAFLLFTAMGALAVLLFFIALIIKFLGKNHAWFIKFLWVAGIFFTVGVCGFLLSVHFDGSSTAKTMDDYICWLFLIIAFAFSLFVLFKKPQKLPPQT